MHYLTCESCHQPVAYGEAVMRSRAFVQVAWHPDCYKTTPAPFIPSQRQPEREKVGA